MSHRCAVFGCNNDRRYPERMIVMPHVCQHMGQTNTVVFYKCKRQYFSKWDRLLHRADYKVNKYTVVCSNHFECGQPRHQSPHPTKYLKGYNTTRPDRPIVERRPFIKKQRTVDSPVRTGDSLLTPLLQKEVEHPYALINSDSCQRTVPKLCPCKDCVPLFRALETRIAKLEKEVQSLENRNSTLVREKRQERTKKPGLTIKDLKDNDNIFKLYTGINSYKIFEWMYCHIKDKMERLHYYRGSTSQKKKRWQVTGAEKPGRKRESAMQDELLLVFMKLRLNLVDEDLAFRFSFSASVVSSIISTLLPFLSAELCNLIHWPTRTAIQNHFPSSFRKYGHVRAIIDCTEVQTQRPSKSDINSKLYSNYKQRHTYKVLVACTPGGSISYLSSAAGGDMSDVQIVRESGFLDLLEKGDVVLADKGFKDKTDFLLRGSKLVIPDFSKKGVTFSEGKNITNTGISNARIHVERAIGRIKEFRILKGDFPLLRNDIVDHVFCVCGVLVNLQGILVPL